MTRRTSKSKHSATVQTRNVVGVGNRTTGIQSKQYKSRKGTLQHSTISGQQFWNREYVEGNHFSLSLKPASELVKCMRWFRREQDHYDLSSMSILDIGCGNGRNALYMAETFGCQGSGFDFSSSAVEAANQLAKSEKLPLDFFVHNLENPIPKPDASYDFAIDMMVSHCLRLPARQQYKSEIIRLLRDDGFLVIKTFLREGDEHAKRMIQTHPGGEPNSYIHPMIKIFEHVTSEREFVEFWEPEFQIIVLHKSHGYQHWGGVPYKRRYMVAYLQKKSQNLPA